MIRLRHVAVKFAVGLLAAGLLVAIAARYLAIAP